MGLVLSRALGQSVIVDCDNELKFMRFNDGASVFSYNDKLFKLFDGDKKNLGNGVYISCKKRDDYPNKVKIKFDAPDHIAIDRKEIHLKKRGL